jgi:hypothetical protein
MKNLKVLLAQLKVAKKYNNKTRVVGLLLEITYNEPVVKPNPECSQIATTAKYYADVFTFLLNAVNKEIQKLESQPVITPEREKACKIAGELFMAGTPKEKVKIAQKLRIWGTGPQVCWAVDVMKRNIGWTTNAIEKGLLPNNVQYFINHSKDLSQQVLLDPEVIF